MAHFTHTLVEYSETDAYINTIIYWHRQHEHYLDAIFGFTLLLWMAITLQRSYQYCTASPTVEVPMDKQRLRTELVNIEHAIAALNDHRTCIMLKLKRD